MPEKPIHKILVDSEKDKSKKYMVNIFADETAFCDCPSFMYRGHKDGTCKHIKKAKDHLKKQNDNKS